MIRRVTPRFFAIACMALTALVAQVGLAAACDAMCAAPAAMASPVTAAVSAHAGHCQTPGTAAARAQAGHRVAPCQHESEPTARAAESRPTGRHESALVPWSAAASPALVVHHLPPLRPHMGSPQPPRSVRPPVLRL